MILAEIVMALMTLKRLGAALKYGYGMYLFIIMIMMHHVAVLNVHDLSINF
jgi:hypothetical protein